MSSQARHLITFASVGANLLGCIVGLDRHLKLMMFYKFMDFRKFSKSSADGAGVGGHRHR